MKQFLLTCCLATALAAGAQDTFYVDQSNGDDTNPGTAAAPWATFNVAKWTSGCTVIVKGEYYVDAEAPSNVITVDATLAGEDNAIVYGYEPGEEEPSDFTTFFTCAENKLTVKDITFANYYNNIDTKGSYNGGVFSFEAGSELVLENVKFSDLYHGVAGRRGAAIGTKGILTATNVTFENCTATQGGAVAIMGNRPAKFTSCKFIGNNNNMGYETAWGARGGAIFSNADGADITIDKCYFEKNITDCPLQADRKYASGGAIYVMGPKTKLYVSNSVFYGNVGGYAGAAFGMNQSNVDDNVLDIRFSNNTFLDNTSNFKGTAQGILVYLSGGSTDHNYKGLVSFVNNTSINNNTDNTAQSVFFTNSNPMDMVFVNNISLDKKILGEGEDATESGYGWVLQEQVDHEFNSVNITNNIIEGGIGGGHKSFGDEYLNSDEAANMFPAAAIREQHEVDNELSEHTNGLYLALGENSSAIDAGTNTVMYNGGNLVPQTDALGNGIANNIRDLGAWEFGAESGIASVIVDSKKLVYDAAAGVVSVGEVARVINVYSVAGSLVAHVENAESVSVASLAKGAYIVAAIVNGEAVAAKIVL